jgi:tetratricopeptide (TPR) repeat protein
LSTAQWKPERAASMRFLGRCHDRIGQRAEAHEWHLKACAESQVDREPWFELGKHYYTYSDWNGTYFGMRKALDVPERTASYICEPAAWFTEPYDMLSIACCHLNRFPEAYENALKALEFEPDNERIQNNIKYIETKIK